MQTRSVSNIKVIDVSRHQGTIDWGKVAADGVKGVFIKASEGTSYRDPLLEQNATGANGAGLKIGYYHYARPENGNSAEAEARVFYNAILGLPVHLPLVLDVEGEAADLGPAKLTEWCHAFLTELERLCKHQTSVMLYTGASFARSYLGKKLAAWPLWIAHYGVDKPMSNPTWGRWEVFQWTSTGRVAGIAGNVDINAMEQDFYERCVSPSSAADLVPKVVVNDELAATGEIRNGKLWAPVADVLAALGVGGTWNGEQKKYYVYTK